jgi:hypothetical protein
VGAVVDQKVDARRIEFGEALLDFTLGMPVGLGEVRVEAQRYEGLAVGRQEWADEKGVGADASRFPVDRVVRRPCVGCY